MQPRPSIAYVIDPRFPGGTSAAVAAELEVAVELADVSVFGIESAMFKGRTVAPALADALGRLGLTLAWDPRVISADLVVLHNPSFLKFQTELASRLIARHLVVVTHENFLRPGGNEPYDVRACLDLIGAHSLGLRRSLAPVSDYNRAQTLAWQEGHSVRHDWQVLPETWFNIFTSQMTPPTNRPADRRGRHSRAGLEKFPALDDLDLCFPAHAGANVILGADNLIREGVSRPHWQMHRFGALPVSAYFDQIDFMVYFTAPTLRESFGRVLAEAIAAGKVVICDPGSASAFKDAVIAAKPAEVDAIIARLVADPAAYRAQVTRAQKQLRTFSPDRFKSVLEGALLHPPASEVAA